MSPPYNKRCKIRIIAVDDSPDNLSLIEIIFDDPKYDLELAGSGREALAKIDQKIPDLILLDVMMPDMDGIEVTRRIRQNEDLPYVPILLITAHDRFNAKDGFDAGVDGLIRKPFDIDELQDRVATLTQGKRKHEYSNIPDLPSSWSQFYPTFLEFDR